MSDPEITFKLKSRDGEAVMYDITYTKRSSITRRMTVRDQGVDCTAVIKYIGGKKRYMVYVDHTHRLSLASEESENIPPILIFQKYSSDLLGVPDVESSNDNPEYEQLKKLIIEILEAPHLTDDQIKELQQEARDKHRYTGPIWVSPIEPFSTGTATKHKLRSLISHKICGMAASPKPVQMATYRCSSIKRLRCAYDYNVKIDEMSGLVEATII